MLGFYFRRYGFMEVCTFYIFFQKTSFCVQTLCVFLSVFVFNSISSLKTFQDLCNDWVCMYLVLCFLKLKKSSVILFSVYINYLEYIKIVLWKHAFRRVSKFPKTVHCGLSKHKSNWESFNRYDIRELRVLQLMEYWSVVLVLWSKK